jgi:hypothetical protein
MFLMVAFPILHPVILPMAIQTYSQQAYDFAKSIPDGSYVLVEGGNIAAIDPSCGPGTVLFVYHMLTKNCKLVFFSIGAEQAFWTQKEIDKGLAKLVGMKAYPVAPRRPTSSASWRPIGRSTIFFYIHFKKTDAAGDNGLNHRMYCTTTKDFKTFSPTRLFFDPGFSTIDATMVQAGGKYHLIFKDETLKPVYIVGAKNGIFSGKVVAGSTKPIKNLSRVLYGFNATCRKSSIH